MKKILLKFLKIETVEIEYVDLQHSLRVATAMLLVEVTRADFIVEASERQKLRELLARQFELPAAELDALLEQAESEVDHMVSIQHITRLLNQHYDHAMKVQVVEMMWQMVFADGEKDHYEEHLIRQVADLLYLSHAEFIQARHKAEPES